LLGIIFTGGDGPPSQIAKQLVEEEARNLGFTDVLLVAADSGLVTAERAGIKPGWIIGDMDSLEDERSLASYPPDRIIYHEHDKDYTDTELAFSHVIEHGCNYIWIIGGGGGRIDHLFAIRSLFERDIFPQRWITDFADIRCIDATKKEERKQGAKCEFSCWVEKEIRISIFPLGVGPWEVKSTGLKWPLDNLLWNRGFYGLSNVAEKGQFSITAEKGRFMVILPLLEIW
jgi:thiamine pyrophosphokinase